MDIREREYDKVAFNLHPQNKMNFTKSAEEKFGQDRADELRPELEQLASEIEKLRSVRLDIEDEP